MALQNDCMSIELNPFGSAPVSWDLLLEISTG